MLIIVLVSLLYLYSSLPHAYMCTHTHTHTHSHTTEKMLPCFAYMSTFHSALVILFSNIHLLMTENCDYKFEPAVSNSMF